MATDNMNLTVPVVEETLGPTYAEEINDDLDLIDAHDHSPGKGVLVKPDGMNINADLPFNSHNATELNSAQFDNLSDNPSLNASVYFKSGDFWIKNAGGTAVQVTSGGSVNASTDGISRSFEGTLFNSNTVIGPSATYSMIFVDTTSAVTITLPAANAVSDGRFYEIHDATGSASSNNVTINRAGSDTIDGGTQFKISQNYGSIRLTSDGSSKWALSENKFTASKVMVTDANGNKTTATPSVTEINYVAGVTSLIQTQFNAVQTQLTSMRIPRPSFAWNSADTSQLIIGASVAKPAIIKIGSAFYTNTTDYTIDLDTAGAGGLDTGSKAANTMYYVYGILPASGSTFRACVSASDPNTGPTGFSTNWSYLGSFRTVASSAVSEFTYNNGINLFQIDPTGVTYNTSGVTVKTVNISAVATSGYFRCIWTAINAAGDVFSAGPSTTNRVQFMKASSTSVSLQSIASVWIPITTARSLGGELTISTLDSVSVFVLGWAENPMDWP